MKAKDLNVGDLFKVRNGTRNYRVTGKHEDYINARVLNGKNSRRVYNNEDVFGCDFEDDYYNDY